MIDTLIQYGFTYSRSCRCDGFKTDIYKNGVYEVKVRKGRNTFKIRQHGISRTGFIPSDLLLTKLNEIFKFIPAQTA